MDFIFPIIEKAPEILGYVTMVLTGLYGLFLLIPGEQPEKAIKAILDLTSKLSKK